MASELLKNRALIQKLKEPEVPVVKFNLADAGFEELFTLPEPKPQELLDIQEDVRIQRKENTMNKARPFLMDESVDFIEREEFDRGGMAAIFNYLENLPQGTNVTMADIVKYASDNNLEFNESTLYKALENPDRKQIAKSGNEAFVYGEKKRKQLKKINNTINLEKRFSGKVTNELLESLDNYIKNTPLDLKAIGEEIGYKPTKKGQGGNFTKSSPLFKASTLR